MWGFKVFTHLFDAVHSCFALRVRCFIDVVKESFKFGDKVITRPYASGEEMVSDNQTNHRFSSKPSLLVPGVGKKSTLDPNEKFSPRECPFLCRLLYDESPSTMAMFLEAV